MYQVCICDECPIHGTTKTTTTTVSFGFMETKADPEFKTQAQEIMETFEEMLRPEYRRLLQ
ncbi:MAG: hypothetical protein J3T61_03245 [Candidatus Brocadiales bacterium]|nr:hypothetical protein [Candidatus Bathyanammoxibius sp.]